jgi:hypothetical protein
MITRPTTAQLIEVVRRELAERVADDYNAATEVLSRCLEATFAVDGDLHDTVIGLLDQRLGHETDVIGPDFQLVGRQ